ncbi:MAG: helix-turn-helix domain-containing protein [Gammaproteobacteria bacterium]|nr:helix-turn-helix domain-containing protein [Gammaproteobacteria bacterium]
MSKKVCSVNKRLFSEREAAEYLGVSRSYLRQDRMNGKFRGRTPGPDYCQFGKMIRYDKAELDQWIENNSILRNQKKAVKSVHINT